MQRADEEAAAHRHFGEGLHGAREPALGLDRAGQQRGRVDAGDGGGERQRGFQFIIMRAGLAHALDAPGVGGFVAEQRDGGADLLQRRLEQRHGVVRQGLDDQGFERFGAALRQRAGRIGTRGAHHAFSTKRSSTRLSPAFSKAMSSRSSSTPVTRP